MWIMMSLVGFPIQADDYAEEAAQFRHKAILLCNLSLEQRQGRPVGVHVVARCGLSVIQLCAALRTIFDFGKRHLINNGSTAIITELR